MSQYSIYNISNKNANQPTNHSSSGNQNERKKTKEEKKVIIAIYI